MPNFPCELIEDILRRLPVKSLKRFRAVAKSWCLLIDSDGFVKLHLHTSLASNSNRHLILGGLGLYTVHVDCLDKAHVIKPPFYYRSVDSISSSCNGLVLVMSEPPVLYNPFCRDYKVLPGCGAEHLVPLGCYARTTYGFGYDSRNDDYKVVRVVEFRNEVTHAWVCSEGDVYSLRCDSWRGIEEGFGYPLPFLRGHWGVHVDGALHTLVGGPGDVDLVRIMGFCVRSERHYEVGMPPGVRVRDGDVSLDVVEGNLAVVCTKRARVVVWVMNEYGVKESWTKLLSISPPVMERHSFVRPLVWSRDGERILLNCDDKRLLWYDLVKKSVENVSVEGLPFVFYAEACVESLVSVNKQSEVKKQGQEKKKGKKILTNRDDFLSEGFKLVL